MSLCRLCGEEKSPLDLSVELSDTKSSNWSYRDLIEHHTRVSLKFSKLLPQSICEECRDLIDRFVEFSGKVQIVQSGFDYDELDSVPEIKEYFVQVEELLVPETENCANNSPKRKRSNVILMNFSISL